MFIFFSNKTISFILLRFTFVIKTCIIFTLEIFNKFFNFIIIHFCILIILSNVCFLYYCISFLKMKKDNRKATKLN